MRFIDSDREFLFSSAVVHGGRVFEAVVAGIPDGSHVPVAVNAVWKGYLCNHPVCRRAYGVELQAGMRVEAAFTARFLDRLLPASDRKVAHDRSRDYGIPAASFMNAGRTCPAD
ncbi:MAG: hypothetical protein WD060_11245 [Pirellulales bacterium]